MISASNAIIVIPTYWTWPTKEGHRHAPRPRGGGMGDADWKSARLTAAYDHPTPIDGQSTLPPLLEDLCNQNTQGLRVLVLVGLVHADLAAAASEHMRALLQPFRERLDLRVCDAGAVEKLSERLRPSKLQKELFHLYSYAGIRNLQLLVPHILSAEVVVALDDDERVKPDYMERALKYAGQTVDGERVLGLAGPYLQPDGGVLLNEKPATGNILRDKARHINAAMRLLNVKQAGLVPSPMALGGNMVFHRDLFSRVCFDPGITRGEDTDYLINARLQGIRWWFDPELTILHLPPRHLETPAYQRTREDVLRFIYEREKLRLHGEVHPMWLEPYPAALLSDDLEEHAVRALENEATPELIEVFGDPQAVVAAAREHARHNAPRHEAFARAWQELMRRVEEEPSLRRTAAAAL